MATFARGHWSRKSHTANQRLRKDLEQRTTIGEGARFTYDPADALTLRGIPAIGRGVPGRIAGTRPDTITNDH